MIYITENKDEINIDSLKGNFKKLFQYIIKMEYFRFSGQVCGINKILNLNKITEEYDE